MRLVAPQTCFALCALLPWSPARVESNRLSTATAVVTAATGGHFARAVAVSGNDVFISAMNLTSFRGANGVHLFHRTGTHWRETAVLTAGDSAASERFGAALSADGPLLAVVDPSGAQGQGAIYLFERDGGGRWRRRARLIPGGGDTSGALPSGAPPAADNRLYNSVLLRNGLLVVGVRPTFGTPGQVVIFRRGADADQWTRQRVVTPPDIGEFSSAAALVQGRVVVASDPTTGDEGHRLYVLRDSAGTWVTETTLTLPSDSLHDGFANVAPGEGRSVVGAGADLWVGVPEAEGGRGAVLHFRRTAGGAWPLVGRLVPGAPDTLPNLGFGQALAAMDGAVIASAPAAKTEAGVLHVFRALRADRAASDRERVDTARQRVGATVPVPWAKLGSRLAAAGNLLAAVAPRASGGLGAVVMFERRAASDTWREVATLSAPLPALLARTITGPKPCTAGRVQSFDCQNVELLSFLPAREFGANIGSSTFISLMVSGLWGWTDTATHREFALLGRVDGTAFVEVTDPVHPKYLGALPLHPGARPSVWRDIKVYKQHAFIVADQAGPHGMQVFDLTRLRDVKAQDAPVTFTETAHYDRFNTAHTLALDEATGYAYAVLVGSGGETCGGQLHMIDVRDPVHPTFAGCYANPAVSGTHETECVVYHGPDVKYQGHELCFDANGGSGLEIVDVTDKKAPKSVSVATYPNVRYTHQGWLTEDQRYFFLDDEQDPGDAQGHTRTVVFNLQQLEDPVLAKEFFSRTTTTAHNLYVRGHYVYASNYKAGLRVYDIVDPRNPDEVAYLDTTPREANDHEFGGSWTNYPYFQSGAVGVASMTEGLFLVRVRPPK